ncbi:MAG TPA: DUF4345 family protein [Rhizobiaceae bacterium]|nr:DUF4345 family protein [Rhizobiaceae bacterium]
MEFVFPWPYSQGEWLAWTSAAVTALIGLLFLLAPAVSLRLLRLRAATEHPEALSEVRGTMGGFYLALGLCAILFAQPLIYMTLGFCWLLSAFGRLISILSDSGSGFYNWILLVLSLVIAALPLGFAMGFFP